MPRRPWLGSVERELDQPCEFDRALDGRLFTHVQSIRTLDGQRHGETAVILYPHHVEKHAIAAGAAFGALHINGDVVFILGKAALPRGQLSRDERKP